MSELFERYIKKRGKSPLPLCSLPITVLSYALSYPVRSVGQHLTAAAAAAGVYLLLDYMLPRQIVYGSTKDRSPEVPEGWETALVQLYIASNRVSDAKVRAKLQECENLCRKLQRLHGEGLATGQGLEILANSCLPSALRLAEGYARLERSPNAHAKAAVDAIDGAFSRLHRGLSQAVLDAESAGALDITAEARALERMLRVCAVLPAELLEEDNRCKIYP